MEKYNKNYVCKYVTLTTELSKNEVYNEDYEDEDYNLVDETYINELYQKDFLSIFGLGEYKDKEISTVLNSVLDIVVNHPVLKKGLLNIATRMNSDPTYVIVYLFSYDLLFYTHKCLCEYLKSESNMISEETLNEWQSKVERFIKDGDDFFEEEKVVEEL